MAALIRLLLVLSLLLGAAGCSTVKGWFDLDDDEDATEPAALEDFDAAVRIRKLWSVGVGNGQGKGLYRLQPVIDGDRIFAAAANGDVRAVERSSGRTLWKTEVEADLSGGVGYYDGSLFLGSSDGYAIRLDASSGEELWSTRLQGEVLAPPQAQGDRVVVQTYDGRLQGLDLDTGEKIWAFDSNVPVLTIRGTSTPLLVDGIVFAAFASGRVLAFNADSGALIWEVRVAIPQGRSEIERIVDVDGTMALVGGELYAASYQGRVVAIDVASGRKIWQRDLSSFSGVALGFGNVYVADAEGTVSAYLRSGQGLRWEQPVLAYRGLSRPTVVSSYVAVGDFEGYVHILSQVDGAIVGRVKADGDGVRADMLADGNVLYVFGNSGKLIAYEITALEG